MHHSKCSRGPACMHGADTAQVCKLDAFFTDLMWYPVSSKKNQAGGTDVFAVACTDGQCRGHLQSWSTTSRGLTAAACPAGSYKIISRTGRLEKSVDAHRGACIALRWSYDGACTAFASSHVPQRSAGPSLHWSRSCPNCQPYQPGTALATAGEDGQVKIWSRTGMLRSTLAHCPSPVYCVVWGWDSDHLCYCSGSSITIRWLSTTGGGALQAPASPVVEVTLGRCAWGPFKVAHRC